MEWITVRDAVTHRTSRINLRYPLILAHAHTRTHGPGSSAGSVGASDAAASTGRPADDNAARLAMIIRHTPAHAFLSPASHVCLAATCTHVCDTIRTHPMWMTRELAASFVSPSPGKVFACARACMQIRALLRSLDSFAGVGAPWAAMPGAPPDRVRRLEAEVGVELPVHLRAMMLVRDGQVDAYAQTLAPMALIYGSRMLPMAEVEDRLARGRGFFTMPDAVLAAVPQLRPGAQLLIVAEERQGTGGLAVDLRAGAVFHVMALSIKFMAPNIAALIQTWLT